MQSVEKRKMKDEEPIWNRKEVKRGSQISMPIREKKNKYSSERLILDQINVEQYNMGPYKK